CLVACCCFFFNDTATTEIYTLSLHDALPISARSCAAPGPPRSRPRLPRTPDRKSTRLNSSHTVISYAVFCLKKQKTQRHPWRTHDDRRSAACERRYAAWP